VLFKKLKLLGAGPHLTIVVGQSGIQDIYLPVFKIKLLGAKGCRSYLPIKHEVLGSPSITKNYIPVFVKSYIYSAFITMEYFL
jgi:hypothetical protein